MASDTRSSVGDELVEPDPITLLKREPDHTLAPVSPVRVRKTIFFAVKGRPLRHFPRRRPRSELHGILRLLFGPAAWRVAAATLGVSGTRARRLMAADPEWPTLPRSEELKRLDRWVARLPGWLEEWREDAHAVIDEEVARRKEEMAAGVTRLRQLQAARKRAEEERAAAQVRGRWQKRERLAAEKVIEAGLVRERPVRNEE